MGLGVILLELVFRFELSAQGLVIRLVSKHAPIIFAGLVIENIFLVLVFFFFF